MTRKAILFLVKWKSGSGKITKKLDVKKLEKVNFKVNLGRILVDQRGMHTVH